MKKMLALAVEAFAFAAVASTVYVDCNLTDYAGHDGSSWELALKTIQEGVDKAATDDTVLVQPGRYEEGGAAISADSYLTNRVYISKRITVKSRYGRDSRDTTFIVGRRATVPEDPEQAGMGPDAIRCVRFEYNSSTHGAVLEGFTLVDGATHYNGGSYAFRSVGGGAFFGNRTTSNSDGSYLVDCVITNCLATRGAGMYFGNAVRCRFTENHATVNGAAVRDGNVYWSVLDRNYGASAAVYLGKTKCVNCTIVNNPTDNVLRGNSNDGTYCTALNSVVLHNSPNGSGRYIAVTNCVIDNVRKYYWENSDATGYATGSCTRVQNYSRQFFSPLTCDYRPLSSGDIVGAADARLLERIPEPYRHTDYFGRAVPTTGAIQAGAIQETVAPTGGVIVYSDVAFRYSNTPGLRVNGLELFTDKLYTHATNYPCVHEIEYLPPSALAATTELFGYSCNLDGTNVVYAFTKRGTRLAKVMAPPPGTLLTIVPVKTDKIIWADPSVQDSAPMDGSSAKPFNTLQAAMAKASQNGSFNIVYAKKGRYNRGGVFGQGHTNRVAIATASTYVRFYAVDGPSETFIEGAGDPDSTNPHGYGDQACRCFASITACGQLSGFTLTGGRTRLNSAGTEDPGADGLYGGAIYAPQGFQVEDCVITNCVASRGAVAWGATLKRCLVTDCTSTRLGATRGNTRMSACVFRNICADTSGDYIVGINECAYNCTFVNDGTSQIRLIGNNANSAVYNSIVYGIASLPDMPLSTQEGSYYDAVASVDAGALAREGMRHAAIGFPGAATGDYAPYSASAVKGGGRVPPIGTDFWRFGSPDDFEGRPFVFGEDGAVNAGAYQRTVASIAVNVGTASGVSPQGTVFLEPGGSATFTATDAATRNFRGFYRGDELLTAATSWTFAYDPAFADMRLDVEVRYVPFWYVDPTASDANGGRDWSDAKRTLAAAMALARDGDTVFAAPGVYEEGSAHQGIIAYSAPSNIRARVVVPEGVSLVSRDGAATTVIKGRASDVDEDGFGGGPTAMRCAFLHKRAKLIGFTLTGGRGSAETALCDDARGAGVHGSGPFSGDDWPRVIPLVKDCIITDNVTRRGAGATLVRAVNCRFTGNRATGLAAAAQHCELHNCFVDGNYGTFAVAYNTGMFNCTIGANHETVYAIGPSSRSGMNQRPYAYNSLILCSQISTGDAGGAFTNCVFNSAVRSAWPANNPTNDTCLFVPADQLQIDENGVPVIGANVAVDYGVTNYLDLALCGDTDCAGRPRRVNGERLDVGAYEADWLGRYGEDLGSAHLVAVSAASNAVVESAERMVRLVDGTGVTVEMHNSSGRPSPQTIRLRVTGAGTLSMTADGTPERVFTDNGGEQEYTFRSTAAMREFCFTFTGAGSAELIACSREAGTFLIFR